MPLDVKGNWFAADELRTDAAWTITGTTPSFTFTVDVEANA